MSLELNQRCKERLKEKLLEVLLQVEVENNFYLKPWVKYYFNSLEIILPQKGPLKDKLEKFIGDNPFSEFVYDYLSKELIKIDKYTANEKEKPLSSIPEFSDTSSLADNIIEAFDSLPWEYSISININNELTELFNKEIKEFSLSNSIKLITPNDTFTKNYPFVTKEGKKSETLENTKGIINVLVPKPLNWENNGLYLNILANGLIRKYGDTESNEYVLNIIKSFFGLGIALRLYKAKYNYHSSIKNLELFVHKKFDEKWFYEDSISIESDISERIIDLVLNDLDGTLTTDGKRIIWIKEILSDIGIIFSNMQKAERVLLASKWFFESYIGTNELLSFIQTNIALEILLGDKAISDLIGLGELLGNRCAYLIGSSNKERDKILKDFRQIYNIRSSIVHRGKSKLTESERYLFINLQWMCRRVIFEEIKLLKADLAKEH